MLWGEVGADADERVSGRSSTLRPVDTLRPHADGAADPLEDTLPSDVISLHGIMAAVAALEAVPNVCARCGEDVSAPSAGVLAQAVEDGTYRPVPSDLCVDCQSTPRE